MNLSEIWGAGKPSYETEAKPKPDSELDKQWAKYHIGRIVNNGLNDVFDGWIGKRIMDVLDCSPFELADIASLNYEAFTRKRAQELEIRLNKYRHGI